MNTKKLVGAAAFSLALAGGGVAGALIGTPGSSGAQESTTSTTVAPSTAPDKDPGPGFAREGRGPELTAAAKAIGITEDELRTELQSGKTIAAVAQAHGVSVDSVIDAMVAEAQTNLRDKITAVVNGTAPAGDHGGRPGMRARIDLSKVAAVLGISNADLKTALQSGQSLAQIAEAHGKTAQDVIDTLVTAGVPADKAAEIVNHTGGPGDGPGFGRGHRHGGGAPESTTTTTAPAA